MPAASRHHVRTQAAGTTKARGYGAEHRKARAAAAAEHSPDDPCARCGHPLGPMGPWLHYDHDRERTGYLGFSHGQHPCGECGRRCNLRAGAIEGTRRQQEALAHDDATPARRDWYLREQLPTSECPICGGLFSHTAKQKTCSRACDRIRRYGGPRCAVVYCLGCGCPKPRTRSRYCSSTCRTDAQAAASLHLRRGAEETRTCRHCSGSYTTWGTGGRPRELCDPCRKHAHREQRRAEKRRWRERRRAYRIAMGVGAG